MKVVAQSPGGDLLVIDVDGFEGRIYDSVAKVAHEPWALASIVARGYWNSYGGDADADALVESALVRKELDAPAQQALDELRASVLGPRPPHPSAPDTRGTV